MTFDEFSATLNHNAPPAGLHKLVEALWYDANNQWDKAHDIAQDVHTDEGSWVHAYLHRKEGDQGNASYWYRLAHRPASQKSLKEEWREITTALLR